MLGMPTISVIVPVYKVEKYIHRCVDSILGQTFTDFELLLVDDGSPDNCGAICDEYAARDSRVRVLHQENKGQAAARNLALDWMYANSDSQYVSFVDSDDWVHPRYLELLYRGLQEYGANISQCRHIETTVEVVFPEVGEKIECISAEEEYLHFYSAFVWEKLFDRKCFQEVRFPEGQIYEDLAIWYRILFSETRIALVKETLYYYFVNTESTVRIDWTSTMLSRIAAWDDQIVFFKKHGNQRVLDGAYRYYCKIASLEYSAVRRSSKLSNCEKRQYCSLFSRKMRKALFSSGRALWGDRRLWSYIEVAFPIASNCYWRVRKMFSGRKKKRNSR